MSGQLRTGSLMDYSLPRADNLPAFNLANHVTLCAHNPRKALRALTFCPFLGIASPCLVATKVPVELSSEANGEGTVDTVSSLNKSDVLLLSVGEAFLHAPHASEGNIPRPRLPMPQFCGIMYQTHQKGVADPGGSGQSRSPLRATCASTALTAKRLATESSDRRSCLR